MTVIASIAVPTVSTKVIIVNKRVNFRKKHSPIRKREKTWVKPSCINMSLLRCTKLEHWKMPRHFKKSKKMESKKLLYCTKESIM